MDAEGLLVHVHLGQKLSLEDWRAARRAGRAHGDSPYGYAHAEGVYRMTWSDESWDGPLLSPVRRVVRRVLGFDLLHAWFNRRALRAADVVWTHTEREHLAVAAVLGRRARPRLVAQTVWMWDSWATTSAVRRALYARLLRRADVELTLSTHNAAVSRVAVPGRTVLAVPFGAGVEEGVARAARAAATSRPRPFVLAPGGDRGRDWPTFVDAARRLPEVDFVVATQAAFPVEDVPANLTVTAVRGLADLYRLYAEAAVVVVPLRENGHASGCTVVLEAQRFERPLVTTDVGGLTPYLGDVGVELYDSGDAAGLTAAVRRLLPGSPAASGSSAAVLEERGLTDVDYAGRIVAVTRWLRDGSPHWLDVATSLTRPGVLPVRPEAAPVPGA